MPISLRQFCIFYSLLCCFGVAEATIQSDKDPAHNGRHNLIFLNTSSLSFSDGFGP